MKKWIGLALVTLLAAASALVLLRIKHRHPSQQPEPVSSSVPLPSWDALEVAEPIYDGKLGVGWQDWGWGPHDLAKAAGPAKIVFSGYGGVIFHHETVTGRFGLLSFRYKAPLEWPDFLTVTLKTSDSADAQLPDLPVDAEHTKLREDGWREVRFDLAALNPENAAFDRVIIAARSGVPSDWVSIDKVVLTKRAAGAPSSFAPNRNTSLRIVCGSQTHAISPLIYGMAVGDWDSGATANRIGGNPTTRYNWELGAWNSAKDWFFENGKSADLSTMIEDALQHHAAVALTVPTIGWVAKDTTSVGFPAAKFPGQRAYDSYRPQAGDGYRPDGKPITPGSPNQTSIPAPPELIGRWIRNLRDRDHARGSRGVLMYILDNEPSLWSSTHRDLHPDPLTYDELLDRTLRYGNEVRAADPEALIAGPAEWGWLAYNFSAKDVEVGKFLRPDRRAHGDVPLIPWYLSQIAAHDKKSGTRLLDYLDVHFYPAADHLYDGGDGAVDPAARALRLRSTRALWDPEYTDESWIDEKIALIPRLKTWVAENDPGLKISIGEWSFGGQHDISGALATAEALGRFGQFGLDAAFYWGGPTPGTSIFPAFRAFRDFDGKGARFLDDALETRGEALVSLFASRDPADHRHIVAILLNRDPTFRVTAFLDMGTCGHPVRFRSFGYHAGSEGLEPLSNVSADVTGLTVTVPPYALQVIDITLQ